MPRRLTTLLAAGALALLTLLGTASPAAAVTSSEKLAVLSSWTQTSSTSYNNWNAARLNKAAWSAYAFDWSTDYCSSSPDNPLGFRFTLSCHRHDFGYRNYGAQAGGLRLSPIRQTKDWIDTRFWHEMRQTCFDHHGGGNWCLIHARAAYLAVHKFGDRYFWDA